MRNYTFSTVASISTCTYFYSTIAVEKKIIVVLIILKSGLVVSFAQKQKQKSVKLYKNALNVLNRECTHIHLHNVKLILSI